MGQLLRDAFEVFEERLLAGLADAGYPEVRRTHNAVLRHLDPEGSRASVLAARSGLTRQALTQIVDDLERLGLVAREPDPEDRRAKLVVYTPRGRRAFERGRRVIAAIERDFEHRLGHGAYENFRAALAELADERNDAAPS